MTRYFSTSLGLVLFSVWSHLRGQQATRKWKSSETDPRNVYHNPPISLDESRNLNNGQPGSLARISHHG
jgi:hypothetical protein